MGISACLLGRNVRYDGTHKLDRFLAGTVGQFVTFVPVCPEVECGLPVPRRSMHLVGDPARPRLVVTATGEDKTDQMETWARKRVEKLAGEDLCGFIFKAKSPSSGLHRVKVFQPNGHPGGQGRGVFARIFTERFPLVPAEEEGRLNDPGLRETFFESVFTLKRWREASRPRPSRGRVVDFHSRHKFLLQAHDEAAMRSLGRLVARAKDLALDELCARYEAGLLPALAKQATVKRHVNVLQHMAGFFKDALAPDEKAEVGEEIEKFRNGLVPLIVPVTLLRHFVRKYDVDYLKGQAYLEPHPLELKLRNHA
jgi:uncharacterized protein YbgA (DUF1722 family)/uncharacterized protein YbbK (DUF523 family)